MDELKSRVLVILGHVTEPDGDLSEDSKFRCTLACEEIKKHSIHHVVVTGAFGKHFNETSIPHAEQMIGEIRRQLGPDRSLKTTFHSTSTAFTEEDIFAARRIIVDGQYGDITLLTSPFHAGRVEEIGKLIFRDRAIKIVSSSDSYAATNRKSTREERIIERSETRKIKRFKEKWVDVPLYEKPLDKFPEQVYNDAREEHKHADTLSLSIIAGGLAVALYPVTVSSTPDSDKLWNVTLGASLFSLLLLLLYRRFAQFAEIARNVQRAIELSWGSSGFSYNYDRRKTASSLGDRLISTKQILTVLVLVIVILNVVFALADRNEPDWPTRVAPPCCSAESLKTTGRKW